MSQRGTPGSAGSGGSGGGRMLPPPAPSSGSVREGKLPLPDDFFRVPKLNAKETKYLINLAKRACKEVVYYSRRPGGPMNWVHLSSDDGVEVYQGVDETATDTNTKNITYLRGSTRIYATIDDIADFFKLDTAMKLSGFTQTVGKDLLDQKTLYNLAKPTEDNPKHYVGVKWTAVESPSKLARNRDFCYLECHDEFIDTNSKKRGWVRSLHSIRLPFCPPLNQSHGLVRASLYRSGFVFIESDDKSYVDAVHTLHMDIKGNAPNWLKIMVMKRRIKNISEVNRYFQMRRLCEGRLLGDLELPSKSNVANCQICHHKFGLFSRKSACRKCGRVICSNCGHHFILDYAGVGAKKVKVCVQCSDMVAHGGPGSDNARPVSHLRGHRLDSVTQPIYDSPTSAGSRKQLKERQRSMEEQEYYRKNEDARGLADIQEAKRMHREFEEHMSRSASGRPPIELETAAVASSKPPMASTRRRDAESLLTTGAIPQPPASSSKRVQKKSAYQEFMNQERARITGRATALLPPSVPPTRGERDTHGLRNSMLCTNPPSAPGELLSRARQQQGFEPVPIYPSQQQSQVPPRMLDSIRISSDWDNDFAYQHNTNHRLHVNNSFFSDDTVGAPIRRSDLSITSHDRQSTADVFRSSTNGHESFPEEMAFHDLGFPPGIDSSTVMEDIPVFPPRRQSRAAGTESTASKQSTDSPYDFDEFRRSYFDARNSDIDALEEHVQAQSVTDDEVDFRYGFDGESAASDDAEQYADQEFQVPIHVRSRRKTVGEQQPKPAAQKKDAASDLAMVMALSAMRLYEKENGADLHVSEETRQAALQKMVEIYTNEIERNSSEAQQSRMRQTACSGSEGVAVAKSRVNGERQRAQTVVGNHAYDPESYMEYRNLSDLSASAFRAFQKGTLSGDGSSLPRSDAEPSLPSPATGRSRRPPSGSESKTSSRRNARLGADTDDGKPRGGFTNGSLAGSEDRAKIPSRPNSIRDDVSDTFSELDLIDLPHLMRADEAASNAERSGAIDRLSQESQQTTFSEVSEWQEPTGNRTSLSAQSPTAPLPTNDYPYERESETFNREWASSMSHGYSVGPGAPHGPSIHTNDTKTPKRSEPRSESTPPTSSSVHSSKQAPLGDSPARSGSILSEDDDDNLSDDYDDNDFTSRSKMTLSELERYRASLAELMAEYNQEHNPGSSQRLPRQPEGEPEAVAGRNKTSPDQPDLEHVLHELYL